MKKFLVLFTACFFYCFVYSQTSEEWFNRGDFAYGEEDYETALNCYKKAANLGSKQACAIISYLYYYGVKGESDPQEAQLWAERVGVNKFIESDIVLALISYYNGNFSKTIDILKFWDKKKLMTESKLALAISYMFYTDNELIRFVETEKAETLVKDVYNMLRKEKDKPDYYYAACAILAKMELEKKWDIQNEKMFKYLEDFAAPGEAGFVYCPLAECVMGYFLSKFADQDMRNMGIVRLEVALQYNYDNRFKILYPFAKDIKKYYDKIKK